MIGNKFLPITALLLIGLLASGCATPAATPTEAPAAAPTEAPAAGPTELNIAAIFASEVEQAFVMSFLQSLDRVKADAPHGLKITLDYTEKVYGADTDRILRDYAASGKYQIIWAHSASYADSVGPMSAAFPDIMWVAAMASNEGGGNKYFVDLMTHEPAYLMGMLAGLTTTTNMIGVVAAYPIPNIAVPSNAFFDGARAVNPDVEVRVSYIESWYDPPKAAEAARAQIVAGVDRIYADRIGVFDAAREGGALAFGSFEDQNAMAPDVVVTSTVAKWDPDIRYIIEEWWIHATTGKPYDAPSTATWFTMAEGGSDLAPLYGFESTLPADVTEKVMQAKQDILDGKLVIQFNETPPE
ncbi:MAG: BMP family protein [Thermoleophilia bacterium]